MAGWDARCCEGEDWLEAVGPEARARMRQPHYHVLVDHRDWEYNSLHVRPSTAEGGGACIRGGSNRQGRKS